MLESLDNPRAAKLSDGRVLVVGQRMRQKPNEGSPGGCDGRPGSLGIPRRASGTESGVSQAFASTSRSSPSTMGVPS